MRSTLYCSRLTDLETQIGAGIINWRNKPTNFQVAQIDKNLKVNSEKTLTKEEVKRLVDNKNKIKLAYNGKVSVFQVANKIFIIRKRVVNPHDIRITYQRIL